jgi:hypothetical protein
MYTEEAGPHTYILVDICLIKLFNFVTCKIKGREIQRVIFCKITMEDEVLMIGCVGGQASERI